MIYNYTLSEFESITKSFVSNIIYECIDIITSLCRDVVTVSIQLRKKLIYKIIKIPQFLNAAKVIIVG